VENEHFSGEEKQPNGTLTLSLGIANYPDDAKDAKSLLVLADKALYTAKKRCRNAVGYCIDTSQKIFDLYDPNAEEPIKTIEDALTSIEVTAAVG
jgi:predicted signal transduction protein with EAL and GGDEF domain